jgi:hypothetical protein
MTSRTAARCACKSTKVEPKKMRRTAGDATDELGTVVPAMSLLAFPLEQRITV